MQKKFEFFENNGKIYLWVNWTMEDYRPTGRLHRKDYEETFKDKKYIYTLNHKIIQLQNSTYIKGYGYCFEVIKKRKQMKEEKICSFTRKGYRVQLLKITENSITPYYQLRENRRIKATFTTIEGAFKKFYIYVGNDVLQTKIELI